MKPVVVALAVTLAVQTLTSMAMIAPSVLAPVAARGSRPRAAVDRLLRLAHLPRGDGLGPRRRPSRRALRPARRVPGGGRARRRRPRPRLSRGRRGRAARRDRDRPRLRHRESGQLAHPRPAHAPGDDVARLLDQADRRPGRRCDRRRRRPAARARARVDRRAAGARGGLRSVRVPAAAGARAARRAARRGRGTRRAARRLRGPRPAGPRRALERAAARDVVRIVRLRRGAARVHHLFRVLSRARARLQPGDRRARLRVRARRRHRRPDRVGRGRGPLARAADHARGARR